MKTNCTNNIHLYFYIYILHLYYMTTRAIVNRLLNDGTISDNNYYKFHEVVHYYFRVFTLDTEKVSY